MISTDFPEAFKRYDGDAELLAATAAIVVEDAPRELEQIVDALQSDDAAKLRASAHALKGMLMIFEHSAAVTGLQKIELSAAENDIPAARVMFDAVRTEIEASIAKIAAAI